MEETRTRQGALEEILNLLPVIREETEDSKAKVLLTADLVTQIFAESWRYQFEEDRAEFRQHLRDIINDSLNALKLGGGEP
jgi:hypothetical protein